MSKVTDIKDHMDRCEWCGEIAHPLPLMCPRVVKVKYGEDSEITVYFQDTPIIYRFTGDTKLSPD